MDKDTLLKARKDSLAHLKRIYQDDAETVIADARYGFISGLMKDVLTKPAVEKVTISDRIDTIVLNRWLGIPVFALIFWGIFQITFLASTPLTNWVNQFFGWLAQKAIAIPPAWLGSLLAKGVLGGVGSVLSFAPIIFLLYIALSILEDSGYLARAAFVIDRLMHRIGLHGRSFLPMILGFGCTVPAVMATRTIENPKDRLVTILISPLMSCGARLPVYTLLAGAFFPANAGAVVLTIYAIGIILAILMAWLFRKALIRGESGHFVMELPPYRLPTISGVLTHMWERGRSFLVRAGTIIFIVVILIWIVNYIGILEPIGRAIAPLLSPTGFGQWQAAVTLIFGIMAKELIVGSLGTLVGATEGSLAANLSAGLGWTPLIAFSFMIMVLIYVPCVATIATVKKETNSWKWTGFLIGYTLILGYIAATLVYQIGSLFTG